MSRLKKVVRNIIILAILSVIFYFGSGLYLTPLSAHRHSERSIHYGPSEVVHIEDFNGGKYLLCKYDKWISCNTVKRSLLFFWRFGNQPIGFENDKTKAVDYTWSVDHNNMKAYGIVNDKKVKKVQITLDNSEVLTQTQFYDSLFLFTWKSANNKGTYIKEIKGFDSGNNLVYKDDLPK